MSIIIVGGGEGGGGQGGGSGGGVLYCHNLSSTSWDSRDVSSELTTCVCVCGVCVCVYMVVVCMQWWCVRGLVSVAVYFNTALDLLLFRPPKVGRILIFFISTLTNTPSKLATSLEASIVWCCVDGIGS